MGKATSTLRAPQFSEHASLLTVASASRKLHPVMVAHRDVTCVVVVLVVPPVTVVPKELVVKHREASAGVQSAGLAGVGIGPAVGILTLVSVMWH